jgi:hypothetical protein
MNPFLVGAVVGVVLLLAASVIGQRLRLAASLCPVCGVEGERCQCLDPLR